MICLLTIKKDEILLYYDIKHNIFDLLLTIMDNIDHYIHSIIKHNRLPMKNNILCNNDKTQYIQLYHINLTIIDLGNIAYTYYKKLAKQKKFIQRYITIMNAQNDLINNVYNSIYILFDNNISSYNINFTIENKFGLFGLFAVLSLSLNYSGFYDNPHFKKNASTENITYNDDDNDSDCDFFNAKYCAFNEYYDIDEYDDNNNNNDDNDDNFLTKINYFDGMNIKNNVLYFNEKVPFCLQIWIYEPESCHDDNPNIYLYFGNSYDKFIHIKTIDSFIDEIDRINLNINNLLIFVLEFNETFDNNFIYFFGSRGCEMRLETSQNKYYDLFFSDKLLLVTYSLINKQYKMQNKKTFKSSNDVIEYLKKNNKKYIKNNNDFNVSDNNDFSINDNYNVVSNFVSI